MVTVTHLERAIYCLSPLLFILFLLSSLHSILLVPKTALAWSPLISNCQFNGYFLVFNSFDCLPVFDGVDHTLFLKKHFSLDVCDVTWSFSPLGFSLCLSLNIILFHNMVIRSLPFLELHTPYRILASPFGSKFYLNGYDTQIYIF